MAWNFGDEVQFGWGECHGVRYITHFYCLAVEAGFYSDMVECLPVDRANIFALRPGIVVFACRSSDLGSFPGSGR